MFDSQHIVKEYSQLLSPLPIIIANTIFLCFFCSAVYLLYIVQRAKLCLDFALTLHFFHLVIVSIHSKGFPSSFVWWLCFLISASITSLCGEYLCMQREMEPIHLRGVNKKRSSRAIPSSPSTSMNGPTASGSDDRAIEMALLRDQVIDESRGS